MTSTRAARAFTLIEVMMAGVVFLVVLAGVLTSYNMAGQQFHHLEKQSEALHVADGVVEDLVLAAQSSSVIDPAGNPHTQRYDGAGNATPSGFYIATWTVTPDVPATGMRQLVVKVTWTELTSHSVTLTTVRN